MSPQFLSSALAVALAGSALAGPDEEFAAVVAVIQLGDQLVQAGKDRTALDEYRKAQERLLKFKTVYPEWDPQVVSFRLRYLGERLGSEPEPAGAEPAADDAEMQALQRRVQFLERSDQQYQAQINQLLSENSRLSVRLREALAIRPAAQEPAVVLETQTKLEAATKEVEKLRNDVKALEAELSSIPNPEEARKNARLLDETRKSLRQAMSEAEALRKQVAALREPRSPVVAKPGDETSLEAQLQTSRVAQSAAEQELRKVREENEKLRAELAAATKPARPDVALVSAGAALRRVDRARLALSEGRPAEARHLLEAELAANQGSVEGWYLLGRVRLERGDFVEAAAALKQALELSPQSGTIHLEFARLYRRQTNPDLALSRWHYHRAIENEAPRDASFEKEIGWERPPAAR